jgi:hypothetical protein
MDSGYIVEDGMVEGEVFVGLAQLVDGRPVARIMRLREGAQEPDFLIAGGRWWNPGGDMTGTAYALPDGAAHKTVILREANALVRAIRTCPNAGTEA